MVTEVICVAGGAAAKVARGTSGLEWQVRPYPTSSVDEREMTDAWLRLAMRV